MPDRRWLGLLRSIPPELWERTSATTGRSYLAGYPGKLSVVGFREVRAHPKRPGEEVVVWSVYASEAEAPRREGG